MNALTNIKTREVIQGLKRSQKKLDGINQKSLSPAVAQSLAMASVRLDQSLEAVRQARALANEGK